MPAEPRSSFIVIGGGTAGCVVASRLAEQGETVTLLEAGGRYNRILDIPAVGLWAWLRWPHHFVWQNVTVPQPGLGGREVPFWTGRLLGGGSAINAMIWCRGHRASYDRWQIDGWRYADLLPYFRKSEDHQAGESQAHGSGGPIGISSSRMRTELGKAFLAAAVESGIVPTADFSDEPGEGAAPYHLAQRNGMRSCAANEYLSRPHPRGRLRVITGARIARILWRGNEATGVEYAAGGMLRRIHADREIVLCAGTVGSPQLLMHSGVGPAETLQRLRIPVVADIPFVGRNLRDQLRVPLAFRADERHRQTTVGKVAAGGWSYLFSRRGLLSSNVVEAASLVRSSPAAPFPDLRIVFSWRILPERPGTYAGLEVGLMDPASAGTITIRSGNPLDEPLIDPGYLTNSFDGDRLVGGFAIARKIAGAPALRSAGLQEEVLPGPGTPVLEHIRTSAVTAWHAVGTCALGCVVDEQLRVKGVGGLRIADASVIPSPVAGNAQAAVYAVAEKAASMLAPSPGV